MADDTNTLAGGRGRARVGAADDGGGGDTTRDDAFIESRWAATRRRPFSRISPVQRRILALMGADNRSYIRAMNGVRLSQKSVSLYASEIGRAVPIRLLTLMALYNAGYVAPRQGGRWNPAARTTDFVITDAGRTMGQAPVRNRTASTRRPSFVRTAWGVAWRLVVAFLVVVMLLTVHAFALRYVHHLASPKDTANADATYCMVVGGIYMAWLAIRSVLRRFPRRDQWIFLAVWLYITVDRINYVITHFGRHH